MPLDSIGIEVVEDTEADLDRQDKYVGFSKEVTSGCGGFSPAARLSGCGRSALRRRGLWLGIWMFLCSPSGVGPVAALAEGDVSAAGVVPLDHLLRVFHHSAYIVKLLSIPSSHSRTLWWRYGAGLVFSPFSLE